MKKLIKYSFIILAVISVVVACRKSDNPKLKGVVLSVPEPQFTKDAATDQVISVQNPDAFSAKFSVGLYFANDVKPKSMDVVVIKNNDRTKIKTIQAGITSYPTSITLTGAQLKTLFGVSSVLGDSYDIGVDITTADGTVVPAFSAYGSAVSYGSGVTQQGTQGKGNTVLPAAAPTINYTAICKFTMTDYGAIGGPPVPFTVVRDDWADYGKGDVVPVTIIDATHLSFFYNVAKNPQPIIITVNPNTNGTSVAKQIIGDYSDGNGNVSAVTVPSAFDIVSPCLLQVGATFQFSVGAGTYSGTYTIILQKK